MQISFVKECLSTSFVTFTIRDVTFAVKPQWKMDDGKWKMVKR